LKVIIDKWLLHQPLFRGKCTKNTTYLALTKIFLSKDTTLEQLLVIGYNPSHSNLNSQVYAPLKITSLLLRSLDNELSQFQREPERPVGGTGYKMARNKNYEGNGRMDTLEDEGGEYEDMMDDENGDGDDDDGDGDGDEYMDEDDQKINVDINPQKDDDDDGYNKKFDLGGAKREGGLGDFDTESAFYFSDMLDFDNDDFDEADEVSEEDLLYLKDPATQMDLINLLKEFFTNLVQSDPEYLFACLKNLLPEDKERFHKIFKIKV